MRKTDQSLRILTSVVFIFGALHLTRCENNYFREAIEKAKDTVAPTIVTSSPAAGTTLTSLETLTITFSESVEGADKASNYDISGTGAGTLSVSSITRISAMQATLNFSGSMVDGSVTIALENITDTVGNPLDGAALSFTSDATPKWRFLGRGVSTRGISVGASPGFTGDANYLYAAVTESNCYDGSTTPDDVTVLRYEFQTKAWTTLGVPCLGGASLTATSTYPTLLLHQGSLFLAFTDGTTYVNPDKKVRVYVFKSGSWQILGSPLPASIGANSSYSGLFADGDTLYVSVRDLGNGSKASVYQNSISSPGAWTLVGSNGISTGNIFRQAPMALWQSKFYVAFRDGGASSHPKVLEWNSGSWVDTGSVDTRSSDYVNLLTTPTALWAVYQQSDSVVAQKYDGTSWVAVGGELFVGASPNYLSAEVDASALYVAYQEASSATTRVKKLEGSVWSELGAGLTGGNPNIRLIGGKVYIVYRDKSPSYNDKLSAAYFE